MMNSRPGLISPDELAIQLGQADQEPVVIDLRDNRDDGQGRIPGSVWIGLHDGFAQARPGQDLRYDLPTPDEVAGALSGLGIVPESSVVLADDMGNRRATRAYWVLRYYGHRGPLRVLDGGAAAYLRAGHPAASEFASRPATNYPAPRTRDESIRITPPGILEGIEQSSLTLCDVRTPEEFSGQVALSGRAGRIPGAINIPWERCLKDDETFRPNDQLAEVLAPYLDDTREQVTYCQGGIRASLVWFALHELLGRKAKLYAASWEEWAQDPALPVAVGPANQI